VDGPADRKVGEPIHAPSHAAKAAAPRKRSGSGEASGTAPIGFGQRGESKRLLFVHGS
jgi:hypothetical protein